MTRQVCVIPSPVFFLLLCIIIIIVVSLLLEYGHLWLRGGGEFYLSIAEDAHRN